MNQSQYYLYDIRIKIIPRCPVEEKNYHRGVKIKDNYLKESSCLISSTELKEQKEQKPKNKKKEIYIIVKRQRNL